MTACPPDLARKIARDIEQEEKTARRRALVAKWAALNAQKEERDAPTESNRLLAYFGPNYAENYTAPEEQAEISREDRAFAFSAEGEFLALSKSKTGEAISDETLTERRDAAAEILAQTRAMAEKMDAEYIAMHAEETALVRVLAASVGADIEAAASECRLQGCYRTDATSLWRYFVHSGHVEKIPAFRRMAFLPSVAQQLRGPMLSALEFWLEKNPFARMWTFSSGVRVRLSGVRDRAQELHRRLSQLNAQDFMRDAGTSLVFRSTELGTPETNEHGHVISNGGEIERDETGQLYFHVHAHCVVEMRKGPICGKRWEKLLTDVKHFWHHHWDESGVIRSGREACKYVTKPGEMLKLTGAELVALREQLSRLKLVQPMGSLAEEIRARENPLCPMRLVRRRTHDGCVYSEVKNWNRHGRKTREEKAAEAAAKLDRASASASVRILSRLLPGFGPCGVAEPRVVVMAQNWQESDVRAHPQVARLITATAHEFWAGSAIRVHTCTPTVGETPAFAFASHLPPPRNLPTGAELAGLSR